MTAVLMEPPFLTFFDADGNPLDGGLVYSYQAGTDTPKATFTDSTGTVALPNPVVLDSAGRATIWISGSYKFVVKDSLGNVIRTTDNVTSFTTLAAAANAYFQSFSGNGSQTAFTISQNLGTDENAIMVFVSTPAFSQRFSGTGAQTVFTLGQNVGTDPNGLYIEISGTYMIPTTDYTVNGTALTFVSAPASATNNIIVTRPSTAPFSILNPNQYTLNGTTLTFTVAPPSGTANIMVFAPSTLVGAASASAAAAQASEAAAAASATSAASSAATASAAAYFGTSITSVAVGTGSKSFTTQTGKNFQVGGFLLISSSADGANYMHGQVTSYDIGTGALVMNIIDVGGSGTHTDWNIYVSGTRGADGGGQYFVGSFSRDVSLASSSQIVSGVGFSPLSVSFSAAITDTAYSCQGWANASGGGVTYSNADGINPAVWNTNTTNCLTFQTDVTDAYAGALASLDSDGFTISWTKAGSPVGTSIISFLATR